MKLVFSEQAWEDYLYWQKTDRKTVKRINTLIKDVVTGYQDLLSIWKVEVQTEKTLALTAASKIK